MKNKHFDRRIFAALAMVILGTAADQISKYFAVTYLKGQADMIFIPHIIRFTYVENTGAAFGSMSNARWLFMGASIIAILGIAVYLTVCPPKRQLIYFPLAMILTGGIGNMIDRIALGYVVDFIDFMFVKFYVFNIADSFVTVGAVLLLIGVIMEFAAEDRAKKLASAQDAASGVTDAVSAEQGAANVEQDAVSEVQCAASDESDADTTVCASEQQSLATDSCESKENVQSDDKKTENEDGYDTKDNIDG